MQKVGDGTGEFADAIAMKTRQESFIGKSAGEKRKRGVNRHHHVQAYSKSKSRLVLKELQKAG